MAHARVVDNGPPRFLSQQDCRSLVARVRALARGGGETAVRVESRWSGNLRWARDRIITSGDVRDNDVGITRTVRDVSGTMVINQIDGLALEAAVRRAERVIGMRREPEDAGVRPPAEYPGFTLGAEPYAQPRLWSDATYRLDAEQRQHVMRTLVEPAVSAGVSAAGYLEVSAHGRSVTPQLSGRADDDTMWYYPSTSVQYSVTVRDPRGGGSGWAGVDDYDWMRIDAVHLSAVALDKCLASRHPVAVEPGRWATILEPQAVCDLVQALFTPNLLYRPFAEGTQPWPYGNGDGTSRIGQRIVDPRITVTTDCLDPLTGFPPFSRDGDVYRPVTWIKDGVLMELAYDRRYAVTVLGLPFGQPASGAFHMSGGTASLADMIAATPRGVLVTRFSNVRVLDVGTALYGGYTRDGVWLIEKGVVTKPIKNFRFTESPLFVLNNVEQMGIPQRVFHPDAPVVVPPLHVRDFSFTALADSV